MAKKCYIGFMVAWIISAIMALLYVIYINVAYLTGGAVHITGVQFLLSNAACWMDLIGFVLYVCYVLFVRTEHPDIAEHIENVADEIINMD